MANFENAYLNICRHLENGAARNLFLSLTFSLAFVFHAALVHAQTGPVDFERVSAWYGYPNSFIEDIKEDRFGFLWFGTNEGLFRYDGYEFKVYRHDVRDSTTLSSPNIKDICETRNGELWIGTNYGLNFLDRRTGKFQRFLPEPRNQPTTKSTNLIRNVFEDSRGNLWLASLSAKNMLRFDRRSKQFIPTREAGKPDAKHFIRVFFEDRHGTVWAGTSYGLLKLNPGDSTFQHILPDPDPESENNKLIEQLCEASDGSFWLATKAGLINWNPDTKAIKNSFLPADIENPAIIALILDRKGNPWFAFDNNGLGVYDIQQKQFNHYKYEANRNKSLNTNTVSCLFEDRFQNIWIGTGNGISKIRRDHSGFELFFNIGVDGNIANLITRVMRDSKGTIWTKTPEGIYAIEKGKSQGKKIEELPLPDPGGGGDWFLEDHNGNIWFSISGKGLYRRAANEKTFQKVYFGDTLSRAAIFKMAIDPKDKAIFWIGTALGLCRLNWKTSERRWYEPMQDIPEITSNRFIIFDQYGDDEIWAYYTYSNSLGRFDKRTGKFELFRPDSVNRAVLEGVIKDIAIGKDGNIWIANLYGLTNFNIHTKQFRIYGKKEGMLENELQAVVMDKNDQVWVTGNRFFARLDQRRDTFYNYLVPKEALYFQNKTKHVATDGTISFGTINGIFSFHPDRIRKNPVAPNVILTDFKVKTESYLLDQAFEETKMIVLSHNENDIAFEFSALHYINPQANKYKCRLIGFDKNWRDLGAEHKMNYTNLSPGQYTFQVVASNSDGVWNKDGLNIRLTITPAFWQTLWFRSLLALMVVSIGYAIFKSRQYQLALKREKALAEQQAEYKTRFLAEVSHEIRTPMNAIIGLSNLALDAGPDGKLSKYIAAIRQSSQNLLAIINDLLDHTKLEAGKFTLVNKPFRLAEIVDQLNNNFRFKAEEKGLEFYLDTLFDKDTLLMGDPIRLLQILTNLLANAIKFTERGKVWLSIQEIEGPANTATVRFEVGDTGIGIPESQIETIFERFQQAGNHASSEQGTGLGLGITRRLVELHGSTLHLESQLGTGTKLFFEVPFEKATSERIEKKRSTAEFHFSALKILLVEDHELNQLIITEILKKHIPDADIHIAGNGKIALEQLQQQAYDLILMDIKMPVMDGYATARAIRASENERWKQIPILAVTANALPEQLKKCIAAGMDDVLTKPVDAMQLLEKIQALTSKQLRIDRPKLKALLANDEKKVKQYLSLFKAQMPVHLEQLQNCLEKGELEQVSILAHDLKSQFRYLGLEQIAEIAYAIEQQAETGNNGTELVRLANELKGKALAVML